MGCGSSKPSSSSAGANALTRPTTSKAQNNRKTRPVPLELNTRPAPSAGKVKAAQGPGYRLSPENPNPNKVNPKEAAAQAAEARLLSKSQSSKPGKLSAKLEEEKRKNRTQLLTEANQSNKVDEPLVFD